MIESRACPECGAEVPIGRLSCGACGALLASVDRHVAAGPASERGMTSGWDAAAPTLAAPPTTPVEVAPPATASTHDAPPVDAPPVDAPPVDAPPVDAPHVVPGEASAHEAPPAAERDEPPPATFAAAEAIELPRPPMPPIPGAYLAPSVVMRSVPIAITQPMAVPPAAQPVPDAQPAPASASGSPPRGPASISPIEPAAGSPARVPVLELPFAIAPGIGPRLVAGGAALAVLAFVLPWIPDGGVVIGGAFGSGYFATWGLAAVGNVLPFLLAWVSLVLAVLPNRVPRFASLGVLPLLLGGVYAGLGWTYLIAPLGTGIGIWALAVGALLLAAGGTLVLRGEEPAR
ncbi:MAG TPA: hypothetical protein VF302_01920 [Candidatus Limnocylindrales bacterium]